MSKKDKGINISIGGDTTKLNQALKASQDQLTALGKDLKSVNSALKFDDGNVAMLEQKYRILGESVKAASDKLNTLKSVQEQVQSQLASGQISQSQYDQYTREVVFAEQALERLKNQQRETGEAIQNTKQPVQELGQSFDEAKEHVLSFSDVLKANILGEFLADGIRRLSQSILDIGKNAVGSAISFESAFAGVTKTVDGTAEELAKLEKGIIDLSDSIPATANSIADIAALAGQFGIAIPNINKFTEVVIGLGVATNLAAEEGATAFAQFANITQMAQTDFDRLGSTVVALGNNFATQESNIVAMGQRLAGTGHQVGMTQAQIMGLSAALASVGIAAEAGGSSVSKILSEMQLAVETNGSALEDYGRVAGMTGQQFKTAFQDNAAKAFDAFVRGLGDAERQGKTAIAVLDEMGIAEIRQRDSLLRLAGAGDILTRALVTSTIAWEENIAMQNEVNTRYQTTESQLQIMQNNLTNIAAEIGKELLPCIVDLAQSFTAFLKENKEGIKEFALHITDFIKGIMTGAPVIIPLIAGIGAGFAAWKLGGIIADIGGFIGALTGAIPAVTGVGVAASAAAGPLGMIALVVGGITAAAGLGASAWGSYQRAQEEARQEMLHTGETLRNLASDTEAAFAKFEQTENLVIQWRALKAETESLGENTHELADAKERLSKLEQQLADDSGGLITQYQVENGLTEQQVALLNRKLEIEQQIAQTQLDQALRDTDIDKIQETVTKLTEEQAGLTATIQEQTAAFLELQSAEQDYINLVNSDLDPASQAFADTLDNIRDRANEAGQAFGHDFTGNINLLYGATKDANDMLKKNEDQLVKVSEELLKATDSEATYVEMTEQSAEIAKINAEAIEGESEKIAELTAKLQTAIGTTDAFIVEKAKEAEATRELVDAYMKQQDSMDDLMNAYDKVKNGQKLSMDEMLKLIHTYPELNKLVAEHGAQILNDGAILSEVSSAGREERRKNTEAAIAETRSAIESMKEQAEAAKQSYGAIVEAVKFAMNARLLSAGNGKAVLDRADTEWERQQADFDKRIAESEQSLAELQILSDQLNSIETGGGKAGGNSGGSARKEAKKEEVNELFKLSWDLYQKERELGRLSDAEALKRLDDMVTATKAQGADLDKIEKERYKVSESLRRAEEASANAFGEAVTEGLKRQEKERIEGLKDHLKEQNALLKDAAYKEEEILVDGKSYRIKLLNDEYKERAWAVKDDLAAFRDAQDEKGYILSEAQRESLRLVDEELSTVLDADEKKIQSHLGVIALTNAQLAAELTANKEALDALDDADRKAREDAERKRNEERETRLRERIDRADTDEERRAAEKELADFREELRLKNEANERDAQRKKLKEDRNTLVTVAQKTIDDELADIKKITDEQEASLKRISESIGTEQIKALDEQYKAFSETAQKLAAKLVESGEEGQKQALGILATYYPDWEDKGKKFVDYLTDGLTKNMETLLAASRRLGEESANAFQEGFTAADISIRSESAGVSAMPIAAADSQAMVMAAIGAFSADMEGRSLLRNESAMITKAAEATGAEPIRQEQNAAPVKNTEIHVVNNNNYSGITAPELPSVVERTERANLRRLKYSLGGGTA